MACNSNHGSDNSSSGTAEMVKDEHWRAVFQLNDSTELPFILDWIPNDTNPQLVVYNAEEKLIANSFVKKGDSMLIGFPVFANFLIFKSFGNRLSGYFINPDKRNYRIPFRADKSSAERFPSKEDACCKINGKWAVKFSPNSEDEYPAIAHFIQEGNKLSGTFLTETGDYRYLEGNISGENLNLSTFDGAHLFLFAGKIVDEKIQGAFYSGLSWYEPWEAKRDDNFELRNSDSLTFLKPAYDSLYFSFPNSDGMMISLGDSLYKNKALIVQLMGTWCPNCLDESRYLKSVYEEYHSQGLEIISLAFERMKNEKTAFNRIEKLKRDLELPYQILLAGSSNKAEAVKSLPMLNHIMSYPTAIYLNKEHEIVKIHTGFAGPGTPVYDKYVEENKILLEQILK